MSWKGRKVVAHGLSLLSFDEAVCRYLALEVQLPLASELLVVKMLQVILWVRLKWAHLFLDMDVFRYSDFSVVVLWSTLGFALLPVVPTC